MSKAKPWNGKTSSQDYTNLLFSDSESDPVPDLKLPPLKNKKPKRRTLSRRQSEENGCSLWITLSVVTITILLVSVIFLGVTTYWTWQQITELKDQINTLENKNAGTPEEFQALQTKLTYVNKTVTDLKSGKYGLDVLNKSILEMQKQITSLTASATEFQQSMQPSDTEDKQKVMTGIVADLGSNLKSTRTDVDTLKTQQTTFTTHLEDLLNRVGKLEKPGGREGGSAMAPVSADIQELLAQMNSSIMQNSKAVKDMSKLQTHVDTVEKFAQNLQEQVKNISQQMASLMQTQTVLQGTTKTPPGTKPAEVAGDNSEGLTLLEQLQEQVDDLQQDVEKMQTDLGNQTTPAGDSSSMSSSDVAMLKKDHADFMAFRTEVYQDITSLNSSLASLNKTFVILNGDVGVLFDKVNLTMMELSNVTSIVEGLTNILQAQKKAAAAAATSTTATKQNDAADQGHSEDVTKTKEPEETAPSSKQPELPVNSHDLPAGSGSESESTLSGKHEDSPASDSANNNTSPVV